MNNTTKFYNKLIKKVAEWRGVSIDHAKDVWHGYYWSLINQGYTHKQLFYACKKSWHNTAVKGWGSYCECVEHYLKKINDKNTE
jgi:hypothetical protein